MKKISDWATSMGYRASKEFSGDNTKPLVLRFRGEFIASCVDFEEATALAEAHHDQRSAKMHEDHMRRITFKIL